MVDTNFFILAFTYVCTIHRFGVIYLKVESYEKKGYGKKQKKTSIQTTTYVVCADEGLHTFLLNCFDRAIKSMKSGRNQLISGNNARAI